MRLEDLIRRLAEKNSEFRERYLEHDPHIEVSNLVTAARIRYGLSQEALARLVETEQPSIARLESGKYLPNVSFLDRIAKALETYLIIRFGFMEEGETVTQSIPVQAFSSELFKWSDYYPWLSHASLRDDSQVHDFDIQDNHEKPEAILS